MRLSPRRQRVPQNHERGKMFIRDKGSRINKLDKTGKFGYRRMDDQIQAPDTRRESLAEGSEYAQRVSSAVIRGRSSLGPRPRGNQPVVEVNGDVSNNHHQGGSGVTASGETGGSWGRAH